MEKVVSSLLERFTPFAMTAEACLYTARSMIL
jgi:hypothetical protein